ncbi:MAG: hypothetical protein KC912_09930 [Proteobacteria bacterium]|nr:hypothetical protein [Pseudomonadota bacterium]
MRGLFFQFFITTLLAAAGCGEALEGFAWDVTVSGGEPGFDSCNIGSEVPYDETFTYALNFSGADVDLGLLIDNEILGFADGTLSGCDVSYSSVIWQDARDAGEVRWQLEGEASVRQGGDSCNMDDGLDWDGFEEITVVESTVPDIPPGCTYRMDATGVFVGEL